MVGLREVLGGFDFVEAVIAGLDPAIHHFRKNVPKREMGCAG
jgi:hypothetical protein